MTDTLATAEQQQQKKSTRRFLPKRVRQILLGSTMFFSTLGAFAQPESKGNKIASFQTRTESVTPLDENCTVKTVKLNQHDVVETKKAPTPEELRAKRLGAMSPEQRKAQQEKDDAYWRSLTPEQRRKIVAKKVKENTTVAVDTLTYTLAVVNDTSCVKPEPVVAQPVQWEPVIVPNCDTVINVVQMDTTIKKGPKIVADLGIGGISALTPDLKDPMDGGTVGANIGILTPVTPHLDWYAGVGGQYSWFYTPEKTMDVMVPYNNGYEDMLTDVTVFKPENAHKDLMAYLETRFDIKPFLNKKGNAPVTLGLGVKGGYWTDLSKKSDFISTYGEPLQPGMKFDHSGATVPFVAPQVSLKFRVLPNKNVSPTFTFAAQKIFSGTPQATTSYYPEGALDGTSTMTTPSYFNTNNVRLSATVGMDINYNKKDQIRGKEMAEKFEGENEYDALLRQKQLEAQEDQATKSQPDLDGPPVPEDNGKLGLLDSDEYVSPVSNVDASDLEEVAGDMPHLQLDTLEDNGPTVDATKKKHKQAKGEKRRAAWQNFKQNVADFFAGKPAYMQNSNDVSQPLYVFGGKSQYSCPRF